MRILRPILRRRRTEDAPLPPKPTPFSDFFVEDHEPVEDISFHCRVIAESFAKEGLFREALDLARQIMELGRADPVLAYFRTEQALAIIAAEQATAGLLGEALATARGIHGPLRRGSALTQIAEIQQEAGSDPAAVLAEALATVRTAERRNWLDEVLTTDEFLRIAHAQARAGSFEEALATVRETPKPDPRHKELLSSRRDAYEISVAVCRVACLSERGVFEAQSGTDARATFAQARAIAREIGEASLRGSALTSLATGQARAGLLSEALATANEIDDAYRRARALVDVAIACVPVAPDGDTGRAS
jgi:tetratricopeptide (TPR) repeat protein